MYRSSAQVLVGTLVLAGMASARPVVAVSVLPQAFVVEKVAAGLVDIEVLIPPGANEASFEPTIQQMQALGRAKVYVKVGHPHFLFEAAWLDRLLAEAPGMLVVDGSRGAPGHSEDPHIWVSPACVRIMAADVAKALAEVLPGQAEALQSNLTVFQREIDVLDSEIRQMLAPFAGREILVFHPSWGLFALEYGLVQIAVASEAKEPGPRQLAELIEHAKLAKIQVVFVQPQFSRQQAELIAQQIGGRVVVLDPLARDWLENLRQAAAAFRGSFQP